MANHADGVLSVAETARYLNRSTEQVRRYLREGSLPGQRLGGQWFVQQADVAALLRQRDEAAAVFGAQRGDDPDPLAGTIAVGSSGGGDIAVGRSAYRQTLARER